MQHERMRFRTMTTRQLWTRLGRITKEDKLLRFARAAIEHVNGWSESYPLREEYYELARSAREKVNALRALKYGDESRAFPRDLRASTTIDLETAESRVFAEEINAELMEVAIDSGQEDGLREIISVWLDNETKRKEADKKKAIRCIRF